MKQGVKDLQVLGNMPLLSQRCARFPCACNPLVYVNGSTWKANPFFLCQMASLQRVCIFRPVTAAGTHLA